MTNLVSSSHLSFSSTSIQFSDNVSDRLDALSIQRPTVRFRIAQLVRTGEQRSGRKHRLNPRENSSNVRTVIS